MKFITSVDEKIGNLLILECTHYFHKECMHKYSKKQYMEVQQVQCLSCKETLSNAALNSYFGGNFIENLNDELFRIQIMENSNMIQ